MIARFFLYFVAFASAAACSSSSAPPVDCATEMCLTEHYFAAYSTAPQGECSTVTPADGLDATLSLALYQGDGIYDASVVEQGSRLQRFFRPYAVALRTPRRATDAHMTHAMEGTAAQIDRALDQAGVPASGSLTADQQHAANRAVGAILFAGLRDFVLDHPEKDGINVVVLDHLMSSDLEIGLFGSAGARIIGFGISPRLFAQVTAADPQYDLYEMTGLGGDFTPTLFIGDADVPALPGSPDNLVAHELGHCLGLPHSIEPGNLMTPGQNRPCEEPFSPAQLGEIRLALDGGAAGPGAVASVATTDVLPRIAALAVEAHQARYLSRTAFEVRSPPLDRDR